MLKEMLSFLLTSSLLHVNLIVGTIIFISFLFNVSLRAAKDSLGMIVLLSMLMNIIITFFSGVREKE